MIRQHKIGLAIIGCIAVLGLAGAEIYLYHSAIPQSHERASQDNTSPAEGGQLSADAQALRIKHFAGGWGGPACRVVIEPRRTTTRPYARALVWTGQNYREGAFFFTAEGLVGPFPGPVRWTLDLAGDELQVADVDTGTVLISLPRWEHACPSAVELWRHREREQQRVHDEVNDPRLKSGA